MPTIPPTATLHALRMSLVICAAWATIAFVFAVQGYATAIYRGTPQPWWPSLSYALAIFSVWAVLTPAIGAATSLTDRFTTTPRLLCLAAGLPVVAVLHISLFALAFWPIYNDGGRIPTRGAIAERMVLRNLDTNALFYLLVVGATLLRQGRSRRSAGRESAKAVVADNAYEPIRVRSRGRVRLIPPAEVDWIAAAGDYIELHCGRETHLVETSLASIERALPPGDFARIHRGAIVRVDRVAEVLGIGRGDAIVRLGDGSELRMSRRYRPNLTLLLQP